MAAWAAETCRHTLINLTVTFYWNLLCLDVNIYIHTHTCIYTLLIGLELSRERILSYFFRTASSLKQSKPLCLLGLHLNPRFYCTLCSEDSTIFLSNKERNDLLNWCLIISTSLKFHFTWWGASFDNLSFPLFEFPYRFYYAHSQRCKKRLLAVCPSAWNNSVPTGCILILLTFKDCSKACRLNWSWIKNWQE